jgi:MFS family permease
VGWIYGTIYLGCVVSPLIGGLIVDLWVATQWFLAAAHLVGGVLLLVAARKTTFRGLFVAMGHELDQDQAAACQELFLTKESKF